MTNKKKPTEPKFNKLSSKTIDDINDAFGKHLKYLRNKADISQDTMGLRSGLGRNYISDIELGKRNPTLSAFFQLAHALEISAQELFNFDHNR